MIYSVGIGDVLAYIYDMISKIVSVFEMVIHFIFSGISFLWDSVKWLYDVIAILPPYISGFIAMTIAIGVILLIVGR